MRSLAVLLCAPLIAAAAEMPAETSAAFDRYVAVTEQALQKQTGARGFLWVDQHPKEKSLVWLSQTVITPLKNLDQGKEIEIPGGALQHWLGAVLLENTTLERVRDFAMNFPDYKFYFKQFYIDSKLIKRDGDQFDAALKLSRRQIKAVTLNINLSAKWVPLDPLYGYAAMRSTHIGEVDWKKGQDTALQERLPEASAGYLWRQNVYWRIEQNGDGVYVEIESITLSRPSGSLNPSRFLNGFVQNFPREFIEGSIEDLQQAFPRLKH